MMLDILSLIVDTIFPPPASVKKIRQLDLANFNNYYFVQQRVDWQSLSNYQNKFVQAAITANKFHHSKEAAILLASLVDIWLETQIKKPTVLVPIPLSKERLRVRGYNQVEVILSEVKHPSVTTAKLLKKVKHTVPQTTLTREQRLINLKNAFVYVDLPLPLASCRVVLVDDVITTGATLNEARATLAPHLPKDCELICLGLAH